MCEEFIKQTLHMSFCLQNASQQIYNVFTGYIDHYMIYLQVKLIECNAFKAISRYHIDVM